MKRMKKEEEEIDANSEKPEKYEEENEVLTESEGEAGSSDPPLQPLDSPTFQPSDSPTHIDASTKETNLNNPQAVVKTQEGEESLTEIDEALDPEEAQALEQWLKRVPDDPGGLLRRKFEQQFEERVRQGEITRQDFERNW